MNITHEGIEYATFGEGYCRRADVDDEWEEIDELPPDVSLEFLLEKARREERVRRGPASRPPIISRSGQNSVFASELGLSPDEFAERLNDDSSTGTVTRVADERFDEMADALGLDPQEMRDRFAGRHAA